MLKRTVHSVFYNAFADNRPTGLFSFVSCCCLESQPLRNPYVTHTTPWVQRYSYSYSYRLERQALDVRCLRNPAKFSENSNLQQFKVIQGRRAHMQIPIIGH